MDIIECGEEGKLKSRRVESEVARSTDSHPNQ